MAIAAHDITLEGFDRPFKLLDFQMELKPNTHGWAKLLLRLKERPDLLQELPYDTKLTIGYNTNEGATGTLLCGLVENVAVKRKDQYYELSIDLITGSAILDRDTKQVAYQDGAMTYSQVVNQTLAKTDDAKMILATENDLATDSMLIQYNETDWVFVQRLASHLGEAVFSDWITGSPAFYFGTKMNTGQADMALNDYTIAVDHRFYEQGGFLADLSKRDFLYYSVETDIDYAPGTSADIQGRDCRVWYKHGELDGDQIKFTYHWSEVYKVKRWDNESLTGTMLSGTVVEATGECVRIELDIDAVATTTLHPWTPTTGNIFYCMPELGTRVMLYCGSRLESSAKALENIRENGGVQPRAEDSEQMEEEREHHERLLNPDNRFFASQDEKELSVLPDSIGLGPREDMPKIRVEDQSGVHINDMTLVLQADGVVAFQGDIIRVTEPSQVSMIRAGNGPMSTFNISEDFNVCGTIGSMEGTRKSAAGISRPSTVEALGNPDEIEQAAIAAVPLGGAREQHASAGESLHSLGGFSQSATRESQAIQHAQVGGKSSLSRLSSSMEESLQLVALSSLPLGTQTGLKQKALQRNTLERIAPLGKEMKR